MAKADVIAQAQALGIEVTEENTIKEIEQLISEALLNLKNANTDVPAPVVSETKVKKAASKHYEEWHVKINKNVAEKMKINRACVKISDEQAEILNEGVLYGNNTYALMYFKQA